MVSLNRLLVPSMGSQINIVDHVRLSACKTLLQIGFNNNSIIQRKRKEMVMSFDNETPIARWASGSSHNDTETILTRCQELQNHINLCMRKFTTYFMVRYHTSKDDEGEEIDLCELAGVVIIDKNVQKTSGPNGPSLSTSQVGKG